MFRVPPTRDAHLDCWARGPAPHDTRGEHHCVRRGLGARRPGVRDIWLGVAVKLQPAAPKLRRVRVGRPCNDVRVLRKRAGCQGPMSRNRGALRGAARLRVHGLCGGACPTRLGRLLRAAVRSGLAVRSPAEE